MQLAFNTFRQAYNNDFRTVLYGTSADGAVNPAANRAAFDAAVANDLAALNTAVAGDVANLGDGATLAATLQGEILGTGADSLQGQLAAIATPSGAYNASTRLFQNNSAIAIRSVAADLTNQVRTDASASPSDPGSTTTTTTPSSTVVRTAQQGVSTAVQTFRTAYGAALSTTLYAPAADGSIGPAANRPAFDAQVATDLATLDASVAAAIAPLPNSAALVASSRAAINGSASTSLQSELAALPTPSGPYTTSARTFSAQSGAAINGLQASIFSQIATTYGLNARLGHGGGFGGFRGIGGFFRNLFNRF